MEGKKPAEVREINGKTFLVGEGVRTDVPLASGTVYPRSTVEKAVASYRKKIEEERAFGLFNPELQDKGRVTLEKTSHIIRDVELDEDGRVFVTGEVLDTSAGKKLREHLDNAGGVSFRLTGRASVTAVTGDDGERFRVREDMEVISFHVEDSERDPNIES